MRRVVTSELDLELGSSVDLIFSVAVPQSTALSHESLTFTQGDQHHAATEIIDHAGSRLHRITGEAGRLEVRYEATVEPGGAMMHTSDLEVITYLRPSRYCQSDEVFAQARRQFKGLQGHDLIAAVSGFVAAGTTYTPGLSHGTDSAVTTLRTGQGVCRDYAHVVIALLRAMDMPARYAACYAPGLEPMDFHAAAEAYHDGTWYVIDATKLADRRSLVRISTGRDAADCAFLSYHGGYVGLSHMRVDAWVVPDASPAPPGVSARASEDDFTSPVQLA